MDQVASLARWLMVSAVVTFEWQMLEVAIPHHARGRVRRWLALRIHKRRFLMWLRFRAWPLRVLVSVLLRLLRLRLAGYLLDLALSLAQELDN